jgi:hypothetical protein
MLYRKQNVVIGLRRPYVDVCFNPWTAMECISVVLYREQCSAGQMMLQGHGMRVSRGSLTCLQVSLVRDGFRFHASIDGVHERCTELVYMSVLLDILWYLCSYRACCATCNCRVGSTVCVVTCVQCHVCHPSMHIRKHTRTHKLRNKSVPSTLHSYVMFADHVSAGEAEGLTRDFLAKVLARTSGS